MAKLSSTDFRSNRPPKHPGKGDKYLPKIIRELAKLLRNNQKALDYDALSLSGSKINQLAHMLVEFAEDIHNDIGIWKSLEQFNQDLFGTPLPLVLQPGEAPAPSPLSVHRVQYLLWVQYHLLAPSLIIPPDFEDLIFLAQMVAEFLEGRFEKIPRNSGIKKFLDGPNEYAWDMKKKLVWLGTRSYLFRTCYQDYVEAQGGKPEIGIIDDFICQETTCWSGLGVIDILAMLSDITEARRNDLRNWYERHAAFYKVSEVRDPFIRVLNIINEKEYTVRTGDSARFFLKDELYHGSLVPWDGEWYWSGEQMHYGRIPDEELADLRKNFIRSMSAIPYRYCEDLAGKARETLQSYYKHFTDYHGDDLVIYPDGKSMAEDMQKEMRLLIEAKLREQGTEASEQQEYQVPDLKSSFEPELLTCDNGVAVYFNPDEGHEITREFYDILSGLKKKGRNLTQDEADAVRGFIESDAVSPNYVRKLVRKHGDESVAAAFLIPTAAKHYYLEYLMHMYKGHFYRKRYPSVSFAL